MIAGITTNGGPVKIIGLFLKTKNGRIVENPDVVEKINLLSQKLGLPILKIEAMSDRDF